MRRWIASVMFLLLPLSPAAAQVPVDGADRVRIEGVIRDQMAAFRSDDAAAAFAHAAPSIQTLFGTPETFLAMVRRGYAPVYRPQSVEFRELAEAEGALVQRVLVVGPDGVPEVALYVMERQPDGSWRIAGCFLARADDRVT